jgi:hypothetical protein
MLSPDSKTCARAELVDLIESQLNTLERKLSAASQRQNSGNTGTVCQL